MLVDVGEGGEVSSRTKIDGPELSECAISVAGPVRGPVRAMLRVIEADGEGRDERGAAPSYSLYNWG